MKRFALLLVMVFPSLIVAKTNIRSRVEPTGIVLDSNNTVSIVGEINMELITKFADDLIALVEKNPDIAGLNIIIDSPGGSVAGMIIVQTIRRLIAEGVPVTCYANHAASMAFIIFSSCSKRFALPDSLLLWHSVAVPVPAGRYKAVELRSIAASMDVLDKHMKLFVMEATGMTEDTYVKGDNGNIAWTAKVLLPEVDPEFMTIVAGWRVK